MSGPHVARPPQVWLPLRPHPSTWLPLSPLPQHASAGLSPTRPRPSPGETLRPDLPSGSHSVGFLSGGRSGPHQAPPSPIPTLSQRKGWGVCQLFHDASSPGRKPRRGGSDTFLDLAHSPPEQCPRPGRASWPLPRDSPPPPRPSDLIVGTLLRV